MSGSQHPTSSAPDHSAHSPGGRILALDVGSKTIGMAVSDPLGITAQGLETIRRKNKRTDFEILERAIRQYDVREIVVGYPLRMSGAEGRQSERMTVFAEELRQRLQLPVHLWDERLTSVQANRLLREAELSIAKRAAAVDRMAAVLILQSYLDAGAGRSDRAAYDKIRDLAERYTAAWCSQHAGSVASCYSPDGSLSVNDGPPAVGRDAIAGVAQSFMTTFPDMKVLMDDLTAQGDRFVYRWTLVGTNTGPGGTGMHVHISGFEEWRIGADGLIAESHGHFDASEYQRQLAQAANQPE